MSKIVCPFVGGKSLPAAGASYFLENPGDLGNTDQLAVAETSDGQCDLALRLADEVYWNPGAVDHRLLPAFFDHLRRGLETRKADWTQAINQQCGLPLEPRLRTGEWGGMMMQLDQAAELARTGSWRRPVTSTLPVGTFTASYQGIGTCLSMGPNNFPLRFSSVVGTHALMSLVAGNPLIAKPHPGIAGAEWFAAEAVVEALAAAGLPPGLFAFLPGREPRLVERLVGSEVIRCVLFTGSHRVATRLKELNMLRAVEARLCIEAGAVNATFVMESARDPNTYAALATQLFAGTCGAAGAFCTKDGILFIVGEKGRDDLIAALADHYRNAPAQLCLSRAMRDEFEKGAHLLGMQHGVELLARSSAELNPNRAETRAHLFRTTVDRLQDLPALRRELFGPSQVVIEIDGAEHLAAAVQALPGSLVASVRGSVAELRSMEGFLPLLKRKVGRITINNPTTGVTPCEGMTHGGPAPSTNWCGTSSGPRAIKHVLVDFCQDRWPAELLSEI